MVDARQHRVHLHVVDVRFPVEKIERAESQAEGWRAAARFESGHLRSRGDGASQAGGCRA